MEVWLAVWDIRRERHRHVKLNNQMLYNISEEMAGERVIFTHSELQLFLRAYITRYVCVTLLDGSCDAS